MRYIKGIVVLAIATVALGAAGATSASAAGFTYSATGVLAGKALNMQTLTTSSGQLKCSVAEVSGTIVSTDSSQLHITVNYKNCSNFGFIGTDVSPATYVLTATKNVDLKSAITINTTAAGCHQTIAAQEFGSVSYVNNAGKLQVTFNGSNIAYTTTGGLCGAAGKATLTGTIEIERVGGGSISWDA